MTARLLMIALDGADGVLLDRWSADGTLPSLAALRARSVVRRLSAPAGISDDALWASFQFAAPLGEHGRYHWEQRLASGEMGMAYEDERDRESFWTALSRRGNRVAILDVPKCGPPQAINGIHLVDWLVHGRYFPEPRSAPETLAASVVAQFGPAPPSYCAYEGPPLADAEVHEVTANLRTSVARKRAAALHYLASEPWDLFIVAFKEAHCAGHHLWDLSDPRHPGFDAARNERLGDPLRTVFRDLDAAVGDLVSAAGPEAAVAVFSTSDMAPNGTLIHLMPGIVDRLNGALGETRLTRAVRRVRRRFSTAPAHPPCELLPYNENCAALRIHAQDGWLGLPQGSERKDQLLRQAESLLRELTDADSGEAVVAAIDRPSSQHRGARAAGLPDLLVRYAASRIPRAVASPRLGRIEADLPPVRPGNHAPGGLLMLRDAPADDVRGMEDLGALAIRVLHPG